MQYDPETVRPYLTPDQFSLYRLIWNRFVASQMMPATFDETTVDVDVGRLPVPGQGHGAEVRGLDGDLRADARETRTRRINRQPQAIVQRTRTRACRACCRRSPKAIGSS